MGKKVEEKPKSVLTVKEIRQRQKVCMAGMQQAQANYAANLGAFQMLKEMEGLALAKKNGKKPKKGKGKKR